MTDSLTINGKCYELDENGFLANLEDWNESVAEAIATQEGIQLNTAHWEIIWLLRDFYQEFTIAPAMRVLVKQVKNKLGSDKGSSVYLLRLFPESPAKLASKIAGLPKPTNCL